MHCFKHTDYSHVLVNQEANYNSNNYYNFAACDTTMFPGSPFPNADSLTATVPATLPVGTVVAYMCTDNNRVRNGIASNMCDMNGMYTLPAPTCALG